MGGRSHTVTVIEEGFKYDGKTHTFLPPTSPAWSASSSSLRTSSQDCSRALSRSGRQQADGRHALSARLAESARGVSLSLIGQHLAHRSRLRGGFYCSPLRFDDCAPERDIREIAVPLKGARETSALKFAEISMKPSLMSEAKPRRPKRSGKSRRFAPLKAKIVVTTIAYVVAEGASVKNRWFSWLRSRSTPILPGFVPGLLKA